MILSLSFTKKRENKMEDSIKGAVLSPLPEEEENTGGKKRRRPIPVTGTKLKIYGCITMLFYTVALSVVQNGLIHVNDYSSEELTQLLKNDPHMMVLSGWASVLQLLGGLAVPVFAFLLVEGFLHTSNFSKYLLTMLIFAVISEVPYDFAMNGTFWTLSSQNPLFTLAVCLLMLYGLKIFDQGKGVTHRVVQLVIILAAVLWCSMFRCGFGLCTVLLTAVYYMMRDHKGGRLLFGSLISLMYVTGPFSVYALYSYNGQRGWNKNKYVFYVFYPLHLLFFGVIAYVLAM